MTVYYRIQYGGYVGCEDTFDIEVPDDATEEDIEIAIEEDFEQRVIENSCWERCEEP